MSKFINSYSEHLNESNDSLSKNKQMLSKKVGKYFSQIKKEYPKLYAVDADKYHQNLGATIAKDIEKILYKIHHDEIADITELNTLFKVLLNNNKLHKIVLDDKG